MNRDTFLILALPLLLTLAACHGHGPDADHTHGPAGDQAASATPPSDSEVTYVPAYPEDVSDESLSADDVEQQSSTHSHGDEEGHEHGPDGHTHDDDSAHQGEGDEGHSHDEDDARP